MHELGLVSGILDVCTKTAREAGASRVVSVSLRIGDMAEVNEESMDFAWDILREDDPLTAEATMQVEYVRPRSVCVQCGTEFEHDRFHLRCPSCGSGLIYDGTFTGVLTDGDGCFTKMLKEMGIDVISEKELQENDKF